MTKTCASCSFAQSVRSSRPLASVLRALTSLNAKFSGSKKCFSSHIHFYSSFDQNWFASSPFIWQLQYNSCSDVSSLAHTSFPDEYFTCSARCQVNLQTSLPLTLLLSPWSSLIPSPLSSSSMSWQACESRCSQQMRHSGEHTVLSRYILTLLSMELERYARFLWLYWQHYRCQYSQQYENKIYTCQRCQVHQS